MRVRSSGWDQKLRSARRVVDDPDERDDQPTRASTLTPAEIQRRILHALAPGPLSPRQLREGLQLNERLVHQNVRTLRDAGTVKAIGPIARRKYALADYVAPFMTASSPSACRPKEQPPKESWWVGKDRETFQEAATARQRERSGYGREP